MSEAHSKASKKRWEKIPLEERGVIMTLRGFQRWDKMTPKQKAEHIKSMVGKQKRMSGKK